MGTTGLYNCELHPETSLFQSNQIPTREAKSQPVMNEEAFRTQKFPGVDSIPLDGQIKQDLAMQHHQICEQF